MGLSPVVVPFLQITTLEPFRPLSMFQALLELAFVPVSVDPHMHAVTICLAELPFAHVAVSLGALPHPRSMLKPVDPLTLIKLPIWPLVLADSLRPTVDVPSLVDTSIRESLVAPTVLQIT